jgi:hypothetical protein
VVHPNPERIARGQTAEIADTVTHFGEAHHQLTTPRRSLPAGSLVIVGDATHAPPAQIAASPTTLPPRRLS